MKSKTTPQFWQRYARLPEEVRRLADRNYTIWRDNPQHPSLQFKKISGHESLHSARVGIHYRAIAHVEGDLVIWTWIGSHAEYDRLLRG